MIENRMKVILIVLRLTTRYCIKALLEPINCIQVVAIAETIENGIILVDKYRPDIVFLDLDLQELENRDLVQKLYAKHSDVHLVILFNDESPPSRETIFKFAANCISCNNLNPKQMNRLIENILDDHIMLPRSMLTNVTTSNLHSELTERQINILTLATEGKTTSEIAGEVFSSTRTVEKDFEKINETFGVSTKIESIVKFIKDEEN